MSVICQPGKRLRAALRLALLLLLVFDADTTFAAIPVAHPGFPITIGDPYPPWVSNYYVPLQIVDLYGDGSRRLIAAWYSDDTTGDPNAPPTGRVAIVRPDGSIERMLTMAGVPFEPGLIDIEDDGQLEIVVSTFCCTTLYRADGTLVWQHLHTDNDKPAGCSIADLDGDGEPWIVLPSYDHALSVLDKWGTIRSGWPLYFTTPDAPPACGFSFNCESFVRPATVTDMDLDGRDEIILGAGCSRVVCFNGDASPCPGFPLNLTGCSGMDAIEPAFTNAGGDTRVAALHLANQDKIWIFDGFGNVLPPSPLPVGSYVSGSTLSVFEANGAQWLAYGGYCEGDSLFDASTGQQALGWPVTDHQYAEAQPLVADLGSGSGLDIAFGGGGAGNFCVDSSIAGVSAFTLSGQPLPGFPLQGPGYDNYGPVVGTFDGSETTLCWAPSPDYSQQTQLYCVDLGVPWDRGKVQWGQYAFDWKHTSRFRRLWQIDRPKTSLTIPVSDLPSNSGTSFDVTVSPRNAAGNPLGADQDIRIARRPVLGKFVGKVRYDAATGNYTRTYQAPVQDDSADVEFRVFVNDELDDTKPVVHLRGKPKITAWTPDAIGRGSAPATTVTLTGTDFTASPVVTPITNDLIVSSSRLTTPATITAQVRAPQAAKLGWSGLQVTSSDGRKSNVAPVFVYDPATVTLLGTKTPGTAASGTFEWFGSNGSGVGWTLERSSDPRFFSSTTTTIYHGGTSTFVDPAPASPIWYYRVN